MKTVVEYKFRGWPGLYW